MLAHRTAEMSVMVCTRTDGRRRWTQLRSWIELSVHLTSGSWCSSLPVAGNTWMPWISVGSSDGWCDRIGFSYWYARSSGSPGTGWLAGWMGWIGCAAA